jgi:protein SCO1
MRRCWDELLVACFALLTGVATAQPAREEAAVRTSQAAIGRDAGGWEVLDQNGRILRFDELHDKPLVVSFIYTGCFQVCPASTQFLKRAVGEARRALGPGSFRVVSIGFNQPFDGPEALADFARRQHIDDPQWLFVAPRDRRGVIVRQVYGDAFDLPLFIEPLKQLVAGQAASALSVENVWTKVRLYCTVYDPYSGKYRLDYSLFFELFAGITTLGAMGWFLLRSLRRP